MSASVAVLTGLGELEKIVEIASRSGDLALTHRRT
jgi:hypothetical protein